MTNAAPLPHFLRCSPFLRRLRAAATIGRIVCSNGRYLSLPLEHRRPSVPFRPRCTAEDRRHLDAFQRTLFGDAPIRPRPRLHPSRAGREWRKPDWWVSSLMRGGRGIE